MGIDKAAVHRGGEDEALAGGEGGLDDAAVGPCDGIAVAEIIAVMLFVRSDGAGDGVSRELMVGHDCYEIFLFHFYRY